MAASWHPFKEGKTLGSPGSENGVILRDEEHEDGSRITLERDSPTAPFAITCGIYGWMFHTRYLGSEAEAISDYEQMKLELARILSAIPEKTDPRKDERVQEAVALIEAFVVRFP
jgi:hypothetical protein